MNRLKTTSIHSLILTIFILPIIIYAQAGGGGTPPSPPSSSLTVTIPNPTNAGSDLISLLVALLNNVVMPVAAVFVTMWIIWAGFKYVTAQGNPTKIEKAHQQLLWSLIGAGILLGAAGISLVVKSTIDALIK